MTFWEVMLAFALGIFLFAILDVISAGLFFTLVLGGVAFAVLASVHYLLWGREFSWTAKESQFQASRGRLIPEAPPNEFAVNVSDAELRELIQLLEHSPAVAAADDKNAAMRRQLIDKLRMFGV
jgi:hypothetical protein